MSQGDTILHMAGNLTADPELRFTQSGTAVANFTVVSSPRTFNKDTQQWEDGDPFFMRCSVWRKPAENIAESLRRGDRVMITGRLQQRSFETREGEKRSVIELAVDEWAASGKFHTVTVNRPDRSGTGAPQSQQRRTQPDDDPWASPPPSTPGGFSDEPPF